MPPIETAWRYQKAVLWPALTRRGRALTDKNGVVRVDLSAPVELSVRWEWGYREILDANGNTVAVNATVVVDRDVVVGSRMWQGELEDWVGTGSGGDAEEVLMVAVVDKAEDIKGIHTRRELGLVRYRGGPGPG